MMFNDNEIHLWDVCLNDPHWDNCTDVLSLDEEKMYGHSLKQPTQCCRRRARVALKKLLSIYLHRRANTIEITRTPTGKPEIDCEKLHFNVSHSASRALIGVSSCSLGVDIERINPRIDVESLLHWTCHLQERSSLECLSSVEQIREFFRLWVCKEAYCKATGDGLSKPMNTFRLVADRGIMKYKIINNHSAVQSYRVQCIPIEPGWTAAVCSALQRPVICLSRITPQYATKSKKWRYMQ